MTNRNDMTADQLREQATSLYASAGQAEQARLLLAGRHATAENAAEMWKLRTQSSMLRAQARELVALADYRDAEAETAAGLLVPMTRETGGIVEVPETSTVWCENDQHRGEHLQDATCVHPHFTSRHASDVSDQATAPMVWCANVRHVDTAHRLAVNCLRPEVISEPGTCDPTSPGFDPDVAEAEPADVENPDDPDNDLDDLDVREAMRVELARTLGVDPRCAASVWGNLIDVVAVRERQRKALLRGVE